MQTRPCIARNGPGFPPSLSRAFAALPDCIQVFDTDGHLVFVNQAGIAALGIDDPGAILGLHWQVLWPGLAVEAASCAARRAARGETMTIPPVRAAWHGEARWWEPALSPLRDDHGCISHILWVSRDISAHKQREAALEQHAAALDQRATALVAALERRGDVLASLVAQLASESRRLNEMRERLSRSAKIQLLGEFVAKIVHDINNVLMALQGTLAMLALQAGPAASPALVQGGQEAIASGARLVRQLLDFARLGEKAAGDVSVAQVLADSAAMLTSLVGRRIRVEIAAGTDLWRAGVTPGALQSVLFNLAANARDAMPNGGTLRIGADNWCHGNDHRLGLPADLPAGAFVRLRVSDTGGGMTPAVLARAGQPFFTTKNPGSGTGLGLASAFELAEASGGAVSLDSAIGRGTTVTMFLGRAGTRRPTTPLRGAAIDPLPHGDATILLVDRDEPTRLALADMLRALRYTVVEASSWEVALGIAIGALRVDLLLCDLRTGQASGFDLAGQLRRDHPATAVIYLQADIPQAGACPSLLDGAMLLRKPIHDMLLARAVLQQLGRLPGAMLTSATLRSGERLRERLRQPAMRDLFDQWHAMSRALGRLPAMTDIDVPGAAIPLDNSYVVAVTHGDPVCLFRIVRMGRALSERAGRDMTGEILTSTEEDTLGSHQQAFRRCAGGQAHFDYARMAVSETREMLFERLVMPLSEDGGGVTHLLGVAMFDEVERG